MGNSTKRPEQSRAEKKAKRRKLENAIPDVPGDEKIQVTVNYHTPLNLTPSKKRKRIGEAPDIELHTANEKISKISPKKNLEGGSAAQAADSEDVDGIVNFPGKSGKGAAPAIEDLAADAAGVLERHSTKKSKKERKAERRAREIAERVAETGDKPRSVLETKDEPHSNGNENGNEIPAVVEVKKRKNNRNRGNKQQAALETAGENKGPRFIAFIGNLPYSTTTASLQNHFASVKPKSIRHPTEKDNPQKSKGFAFLEFEGYDHMKTCLKLFHHSVFDDGISPSRKINVELTGGGGGNSKNRKSKIRSKNQKLNEERVRRIQEEAKAKVTKSVGAVDESSVHPSRRARVPGA